MKNICDRFFREVTAENDPVDKVLFFRYNIGERFGKAYVWKT